LLAPKSDRWLPFLSLSQARAAPHSALAMFVCPRDVRGDRRLARDMKQINKNYQEWMSDIRSGVSGVYNQSIACGRNEGRKY
jgi:hypothetical protein